MSTPGRTSIVHTLFMRFARAVNAVSISTRAFADGAESLLDKPIDLSLEELLSVEVTSASRRAQRLSTSAGMIE